VALLLSGIQPFGLYHKFRVLCCNICNYSLFVGKSVMLILNQVQDDSKTEQFGMLRELTPVTI
jgi:hypothetical protein